MTEVALSWLMTRVAAPVVGATKLSHVEGAARTGQRLYLEQIYVEPWGLRIIEEEFFHTPVQ